MKIKSSLKLFIKGIFAYFGLELRQIVPRKFGVFNSRRPPDGARIYIGCGEDAKLGFIGCDIRSLPTVQIVCPAWEVSKFTHTAKEIFCPHTVEHFTDAEARAALADWYDALGLNGVVHIIVPDMDYHIKQWAAADWGEMEERDAKSNARWGFAGFYGWQRECDPTKPGYNQTYWDVHKSGYNAKRLLNLLKRVGFSKIEVSTIDNCHLVATAVKLTQKYERQVAPKIEGIRPDHVARYKFALNYIPTEGCIADAACGVGYGTYLIAQHRNTKRIAAFDIDAGALEYARLNYSHPKATFNQLNLTQNSLPTGAYDLLVSFETIEHLAVADGFLKSIFQAIVPNGIFLCSTPNEEQLAFDRAEFKYHHRHYTLAEFEKLLTSVGFKIEKRFTQTKRTSEEIENGWDGLYNIAVCRRP